MSTPLRFDASPGITLVADALGDESDPPVLLFHGGGQTRHAWGGALRVLGANGWRAMTFDLRGHGDSSWSPDGVYDIDRFASDVAAVARQVADASQPAVLVGASLGGLSSLLAAGELDAPAAAVILVDVAPRIETAGVERIRDFMAQGLDGFDSLEAVADAVASYTPHRPRPRSLDGLRKNVRQRDDGRWYWHWDPNFFRRIGQPPPDPDAPEGSTQYTPTDRLNAAARRITIPALLVRGGSSDVVSPQGAAQLKALIPQCEIVDVADAGHMVAGDRNDRFNAAVIEFLERRVAGR